ncbi:MAG: glycosyltransferase [Halanaeroarchaeum sp.]
MRPCVVAVTDTYLPTVNGVTYTISSWRERWADRGGRMDVVYPSSAYDPEEGEYPVRSLPFPFYEGYRLGLPRIPDDIEDVDLVHAHSPFALGYAGYRLAQAREVPLVFSYHTPTSEYAEYLAPGASARPISWLSRRYESWYLDKADFVITPSEETAADLAERTSTSVAAVPNGVDVSFFRPLHAGRFRRRYDLPEDRPLVGYTGRHGYEKNLGELLAAAETLDATVVFGGDGPAREDLEATAADRDVDARFLGFLDREELPEFYSAIDVFAFPSPVETQGLVALEAMACGTPVVAVDAGALSSTVTDGETGYHYERGDVADFRRTIERALDERDALAETCLSRRESFGLDRSIDRLEGIYERVLEG